jgi:hypothetical protein
MKHFLFRVDRQSKAHAYGTVTLWRIVRNVPVLLGKREFNYEDNHQAAFLTAEKLKALPKRCFEQSPHNSCHIHMYSPEYTFHEV